MKKSVAILALIAAIVLPGCDKGDWLGGVERVAREVFNGWDMWETPAVQPHERPMPLPSPGTIPLNGAPSFEQAQEQLVAMDPVLREERATLVYRRFCHHCHGPNGDGRIIVGESFGVRPPDLRAAEIQSRDDRYLFDHLTHGTDVLIPFAPIMTPLDRLLAIQRMRALADAPSRPAFERRSVEPLR